MSEQFNVLAQLFDSLPIGLVVLDPAGKVVVFNRAEAELAVRSRDRVLGADFFTDIAPCMNVRELGGEFRQRLGRSSFDVSVEMSFAFPHAKAPRDVFVRMRSLEVGSVPHAFLMIEDISLRRSVERMREQLQSLLVHDLKNPLAAVTMNLQLLEDLASVRDNADALESVTQALAATSRLGKMTLNLLDISRLEMAELPVRRAPTDLDRVFVRVRNDNLTVARTNDCSIHITPGAPADVSLDEDLVVRALDNLVENAIRHSSHVTLAAHSVPEGVEIVVSDDGPGIPVELRKKLFDKYVQVSVPGSTARAQNRGLGLTFVKLVAEQHGGDVELMCPEPKGTVFTIRLRC